MHCSDGEIRAYLDKDLKSQADEERVHRHVETCMRCARRATALRLQAERVQARMHSLLTPHPGEAPVKTGVARTRLDGYINAQRKEKDAMLDKLFTRRYRPAWAVFVLILALVVIFTVPPVRTFANSFLGLFRVKKIEVVEFNPANLPDPERMDAISLDFEELLSDQIQVETQGEPQEVTDVAAATALVGFPVRLPSDDAEAWELSFQPGAGIAMQIDLARTRALLSEMGYADLELPDTLEGAAVSIDVPASVTAYYGNCESRQVGGDPDNPDDASHPEPVPTDTACTVLVQMPSPIVSAPPELDVVQLGEAFLQLLGLSPEEAAHFSQRVDWSTTLVIPIPKQGGTYHDVSVDGVEGTLIEREYYRGGTMREEYWLMWIKDDIVHSLIGVGGMEEALALAALLE